MLTGGPESLPPTRSSSRHPRAHGPSGQVRTSPVLAGHVQHSVDQAELFDLLKEQIKEKDKQIGVKDQQIAALNRTIDQQIERDRETNILLKLLQEQIFALQAPSDRSEPPHSHEAPHTSAEQAAHAAAQFPSTGEGDSPPVETAAPKVQ